MLAAVGLFLTGSTECPDSWKMKCVRRETTLSRTSFKRHYLEWCKQLKRHKHIKKKLKFTSPTFKKLVQCWSETIEEVLFHESRTQNFNFKLKINVGKAVLWRHQDPKLSATDGWKLPKKAFDYWKYLSLTLKLALPVIKNMATRITWTRAAECHQKTMCDF